MQLFLDKDGVLADFEKHCITLFGKHPKDLGDTELWRLVNQDRETFWSTMPVKDRAYDLVFDITEHDPIVLTGCPRNGDIHHEICPVASSHKKEWVKKNFGLETITCFAREKPMHMTSLSDVLVDDTYRNVKKWREAGGKAVWYQDYDQAIADLKKYI